MGRAANPVVDRREGKGRLDRAAEQRRGATTSGREDERVGNTEAGRQEQYRAGIQGVKEVARTDTVNTVRER